MESKPFTNYCGTTYWYNKSGQLHRENDLPAIEHSNGDKEWWINGELHRDNDLPAIEYIHGLKSWYKNGKFIRKVTTHK
jgi:antitoxin component YwqK of YwqJK toxin-antitoxin module